MSSTTDSSAPPKPKPVYVPFFSDFDKKTNPFWKKNNYNLGRQFEISADTSEKSSVKVKVTDGSNVVTNITANFETKWGNVEVVENSKHGLSVEFDVHNIFRQWNLNSKHSADDVEVTADYRPEGSFWSTKLSGKYAPNHDGERLCSSTASAVVQDSQYNLAVGGEIELEDRGTKPTHDKLLKSYSMGFLYSPTDKTQYSLIYSPDKESNGVDYDFSLFKQINENLSVAGRVEGKAEFHISSPPVMSLGASWSKSGNIIRGFLNTRKEYGASYQIKVTPQTCVTLGLGAFSPRDSEDVETSVGFKLCLW